VTLQVATARLRLALDETTGAITGLTHLAAGLELVSGAPSPVALRLELTDLGWVDVRGPLRVIPLGDGLRLHWEPIRNIAVSAEILVRGDDLLFRVAAQNTGTATIERIRYPIVAGIGRLGGKGQDELTHSHASGFLFHDPVDLFEPDPENRRRLEQNPYPEGFAGSTMQFLAYQARTVGGFLLGTEDAGRALKWFDIAGDGAHLTMSIAHKVPALVAGASFTPAYPVVVAALDGGRWTDAADRYRAWAIHQPWAQVGPRASWLREEVGICTFGISARHDRSAWLRAIGAAAGVPVFHVLGPDWAARGHDYKGNIPPGRQDWFPAVFHPANLAAIADHAGRWAPFEFDLLSGHDETSDEPVLESRMRHHAGQSDPTDPGIMRFPFMCPGTAYWRDWHAERDARLAAEYGAHAIYYDIALHNMLLQCLAEGHDHLPGSGEPLAALFERMYRDTSLTMSEAAGRYVPMGAEVMTETSIALFDFSQHRADGGPYASFEPVPFRDWILDGRAARIPLLTYVFGERAPLRMDGWAKLSREAGDLWYWVAATVLLEGGLLEVNGEFSPLEDVGGWTEDVTESYARIVPRGFGLDPDKLAFLGQVARTRVGPANPWLAHGRMLPPPRVEASTIEPAWYAYNAGQDHSMYDTRGTMRVPSVLARAWRLDGHDAWLVANVSDQPQVARVDGIEVRLPAREIRFLEP